MAITDYDLKTAFDAFGAREVPSRSMELYLRNAGFKENEIIDALNDAITAGKFILEPNDKLSRP